jgi:hypothetical protein
MKDLIMVVLFLLLQELTSDPKRLTIQFKSALMEESEVLIALSKRSLITKQSSAESTKI